MHNQLEGKREQDGETMSGRWNTYPASNGTCSQSRSVRHSRSPFNLIWHLGLAHEQATHAAKLRVELSQSKKEQQHYLKQVEIGRQLERKRKRKGVEEQTERRKPDESKERKRQKVASSDGNIDTVLGSIFWIIITFVKELGKLQCKQWSIGPDHDVISTWI